MKTYRPPRRTSKSTKKMGRAGKAMMAKRKGKIGKARPYNRLKLSYRNINVYRFMRETIPNVVTFNLIPQGTGSYPAMGYISFENLQFNQLPGNTDFQNLFARYKVDKIVTCLTPMFQEVQLGANWTPLPGGSPQLEITKVNTKYMNSDFPIASTAQDQLSELAQLQGKSKALYSQKRRLYLTTINPGVLGNSVVNSSGNEVDARRGSPWLSLSGPDQAIDVPFKHNALIFGQRIDGQPLDANWKYLVTHKVFFRTSQVG